MMRIDVVTQTPEEAVLLVTGTIAGEHIAVLADETRRWLSRSTRVVLDLTDTKSMNIDGMALLYRWARNGVPVELRNLGPNLTAWLESAYQLWDEEGPPTDAPPA